jgi:hypothetical protein
VKHPKESVGGRHRSEATCPPTGPDTGVRPRVTTDLKENPRLVLTWALGLPAFVVGGTMQALMADAAGQRLVGVGIAVTAALLIASYVLRYFPGVLHHEWWARSRMRRLANGALLWAWVVLLVGGVMWGLFLLFTPW